MVCEQTLLKKGPFFAIFASGFRSAGFIGENMRPGLMLKSKIMIKDFFR